MPILKFRKPIALGLGFWLTPVMAESQWMDGLSLHVNAVAGISGLTFSQDQEKKFELHPNTDSRLAWGAYYRNSWGFSVSPGLRGTEQADKTRPVTRYFDIQPFYYGKAFGAEFLYQYYRGFYRKDSEALVPENQFPDLNISLAGLNVYYLLNHGSESLNSMLHPPDERESGVLFPIMWDMTHRMLRTHHPLPPAEFKAFYPILDQVREIAVYHSTLSQGISYYHRWRRFFLAPTLFLGFGPQFRDYEGSFMEPWGVTIKVNMKVAFGYMGDHFHFTVKAINNSDVIREERERLQFHSGQVVFSFGYEF